MKKRALIIISTIALAFGLTSAVIAGPLTGRVPAKARIGVITLYSNKAAFRRMGMSLMEAMIFHKAYTHDIPGLDMNATIHQALSKYLQGRGYEVVNIATPATTPIDEGYRQIKHGDQLMPAYARFFQKVAQGKHLNLLLVVTSGTIGTFNVFKNEYVGYGVIQRHTMLTNSDWIEGTYRMYAINPKDLALMAKKSGFIHKRVYHRIWHSEFSKITPQNIATIRQVMSTKLPTDIVHGARKMGL